MRVGAASALRVRLQKAEDKAFRSTRCPQRYNLAGDEVDNDMGRNDRDIMSNKFFEPTAFAKSSGPFHEWAEDFVNIIAMRDEEIAGALQTAK